MKRVVIALSSLVAAAALTTGAATAADVAAPKPAYKAAPVVAEWNPWMIRVRALGVITRNSGSVDTVPGSDLRTSDTIVPELDISYFFTRNIAAELILSTTRHSVTGAGIIDGVPVGKAWLLPPTLTLQYHFDPDSNAFRPYVGAGINYTRFYDISLLNGTATVDRNSWGGALQVGADFPINKTFFLNVDLKKLWIDTNVKGAASANFKINPVILGVGVGMKF